MKRTWFVLLLVPILACKTVTSPATIEPTQVVAPTATIFPAFTTSPDPAIYGDIEIVGTHEFITQTRAALALLEQKDGGAFRKIQTYIGIIEQGEHSGMWVWEQPPRYEVGDATAFYSLTWYASTIAHDATHSELYHQYALAHPGESVPAEVYASVEVERFCNAYQLEVLKRIDAPQDEIDYMSTLDGTHCDVDKDGDCDWADYQNRDW